jgi:hypothetical protein
MALRDAMRASATQFVAPGENIQEVFGAQTASQWMIPLVGALVMLLINHYRVVAVTDQRILVLDSGKWNMKNARAVVDILPRATTLGPGTGLWHAIETPSGKIRVHRRFFKDIEAADRAIAPYANN